MCGYAIGLAVTLAANTYGWTFNGVQGQPALLYLVPGVLGAIGVRALLEGEVGSIWSGGVLSQRPGELVDEAQPMPLDGAATSSVHGTCGGQARGSSCCCNYAKEL